MLCLSLLFAFQTSGQTPVANLTCGYTYGNTPAPSWSSILNGSGTVVIDSGLGIDDQNYMNNAFPSGFTFDFNGTLYTSFNISANGFIFFGNTDPGAITNPISNNTAAYSGAISALGANIQAHSSASNTPQILVQTTGTAPDRILTIEWMAFRPQGNSGGFCPIVGFNDWNRYDCQIKLYENGGTNSNVIDIIHKDQNPICINSNGLSAQVGLRGATNTDFRTRSRSGNTNNNNTTEGTSNTDVISHGASNYFNSDTRMRYTPGIQPAAIEGDQEVCLEDGISLTEGNNLLTATYQWYASPANTPIGGATSQTYSANPGIGSYSYYVTVSNASGCLRVSPVYTVNVIACGTGVNVTATAGSGGSISPSGTTSYELGNTPTYTFTPDCGYEVTSITVNGVGQPIANSYTFPALQASATIHVTFSLKAEVCNGIDDDCDGTIDNVPNLEECQVCEDGELMTLPTLTWYQDADGDGFGNNAVTIQDCEQPIGYVSNNSDCDDTDEEITDTCMFTITSSASAGGVISPSGQTSVETGSSQTYTITPDCGYEITNVLVNGNSVGVVSSYTFSNVEANQTIEVVFTIKAEICNGVDDDCDGTIDNVPNLDECEICQEGELVTLESTIWYADMDEDGHGDANNSITDCIQPDGYVLSNNDCDDSDALVWLAKPIEIVLSLNPNNACTTTLPFQLGTVDPANGVWGGTGVNDGMFNPAQAGAGTHTITYFVQGDGACWLSASASATMTVNVCPNVGEFNQDEITLYPSQTSGRLTVNGSGLISATMMDMHGRLIETISLMGNQILDITHFAVGVYLIKVESQNQIEIFKVIKVD